MGYFWLWISCFDFGYFCYDDLVLVVMSNSRRLKMKRGRILYRSYCRSCASRRAPRGAVRPSYFEYDRCFVNRLILEEFFFVRRLVLDRCYFEW